MRTTDIPQQRVIGPLAAIPEKLAQLGVDATTVFEGQAIRAADLVPGALVPFTEISSLLARCAAATDCPHFGLLLGEGHDHRALGLIGQLMASAPTLGEALQDFVHWQLDLSRGAASYLYRAGDDYFFGYGIYERRAPGSLQIYDLAMTVGRNIVASLSADEVSPEEILICHRAPQARAPYERILRSSPRFDQDQASLILPHAAMQHPLPGADAALRAALIEKLTAVAGPNLTGTIARARHLLRSAACLGDMTLAALARRMELHPKTLERRLASEGSGFEPIRDEVRYAIARDLLDLTDLPVGEVAHAVSLSSHSTFDHAFRRWSGMSPTEWRQKQIAKPSSAPRRMM